MIIVLRSGESASEVEGLLSDAGAEYRRLVLYDRDLVVAWPERSVPAEKLTNHPAVEAVVKAPGAYQLSSRAWKPDDTKVSFGGAVFGGGYVSIIAGPCSAESREQVLETARHVKKAGAHALRGGCWKPRTSPYSFQGWGPKALEWMAEAREETGLPIVVEALSTDNVPLLEAKADCIQIGARNMQNTPLLRAVGKTGKPVLLKRGFGNTIDELLCSADYVMLEGCGSVILCERGIRSYERSTRFTFDISAIPVLKKKSHLPVIADPSHPAGDKSLVEPLALAALAAGADGLIVEVHAWPEKALSDSKQQLTPREFQELMEKARLLVEALGRRMP